MMAASQVAGAVKAQDSWQSAHGGAKPLGGMALIEALTIPRTNITTATTGNVLGLCGIGYILNSEDGCGRYFEFVRTRMKSDGDFKASSSSPRFIRLKNSAEERALELIDR
jgi:hypothetical protein